MRNRTFDITRSDGKIISTKVDRAILEKFTECNLTFDYLEIIQYMQTRIKYTPFHPVGYARVEGFGSIIFH